MNATAEERTFLQNGAHPHWIRVNKYVVDGEVTLKGKCDPGKVFLFCSSPNPLPPHGRPTYRNNEARPTGVSSYYNVMWDGRICRGRTKENKAEKSFIEYFNVGRRRKMGRNGGHVEGMPCSTSWTRGSGETGEGGRPKTRTNFAGETISYLEELPLDSRDDGDWEIEDLEDIKDMDPCPSHSSQSERREVGSQVYPGEILDHSYRIKPICEALVGKVVEQAILELLEEEELACLRDQDLIFEGKKKEEELGLKKLEEDWIESHKPPRPELPGECDGDNSCVEEPWIIRMTKMIQSDFNVWVNQGVELEMGYKTISRLLLDDVIRSVVAERQREYFLGLMYQEDEMDMRRFELLNTPVGPED